MTLIYEDRVKETTTGTGTGPVTLLGAATGFRAFSAVLANNDTCIYCIDDNAGAWEVGLGTYATSGNTLTRTTVLRSSNSNAAVSFAAGTKDVFLTLSATKAVTSDKAINDFGGNELANLLLSTYNEKKPTAVAISSGTATFDFSLGRIFELTHDANITTTTFSNVPSTGKWVSFAIRRVKDATGTTRSWTFPASFKWPAGGTAPSLTQTTGAVDWIYGRTGDGGTRWDANSSVNYA
jgi:hypothetical protein